MTEILLLGTFHFAESNIDFFSDDAQRKLWLLNERLMEFCPDAVAVEAAFHAEEAVNAAYAKFSTRDLSDYGKMRNDTLGKISTWGDEHDITYKNENIQVGFRLAKTAGLDRVHAIDDDTELDDISAEMSEEIQREMDAHRNKMNPGDDLDILNKFHLLNSDEWSYHNHQMYLLLNAVGAGATFDGAQLVGAWYTRNLKIFANLQKMCSEYKRIFVLYGAGHLHILRDLIHLCESMRLVDVRDYLGSR